MNLFDLGIVLAVAFLIAGLGLTRDAEAAGSSASRRRAAGSSVNNAAAPATVPLPAPAGTAPATGHGQEVGTVYRLADGRLVYVRGR